MKAQFTPLRRTTGITLIELLVVIAILLPALGIGCISNLKQIQLAWTLYSGDNNEFIVLTEDSPSWARA